MRPLKGIKVLDFSTLLPGPLATLLLAEAGAEVIKVERPGRGDEMRTYEPKWGKSSVNFAMLNRGKKSVALDLKDPRERERLMPLLESADILVEQFRAGVMERLGLGWETLSAINPRLIYCSITGYGQTGPKRDRAGHDLNYIGDSGLLSLSRGPTDAPVVPPVLAADIAGGAYPAVMNILLALRERETTGRGRFLDIAMAENTFTFMYWALGDGLAANQWPGNATAKVTGGSPRYHLYATADDQIVAAAPLEEKFWTSFCDAVGLAAALRDDQANPGATTEAVSKIIRSRPAAHWRKAFEAADCCASVVASAEEALRDTHFRSRGVFDFAISREHGSPLAALPVPIDRAFRASPGEPVGVPDLAADNADLLR